MPDEARDWETLRSDAIRAAREVTGDDELAETVTDAILEVFDEEAVNRLADEHIANTNLRSMDFRNGAKMEFQAARELAAHWVGAARALLEGAENYSETTMTFGIPEDRPQRYSFVVQKAGKLTPHEARKRAETERDETVRLLEEALRIRMYGERAPGGTESWREWERKVEVYLRSLLPPEREDEDRG